MHDLSFNRLKLVLCQCVLTKYFIRPDEHLSWWTFVLMKFVLKTLKKYVETWYKSQFELIQRFIYIVCIWEIWDEDGREGKDGTFHMYVINKA